MSITNPRTYLKYSVALWVREKDEKALALEVLHYR